MESQKEFINQLKEMQKAFSDLYDLNKSCMSEIMMFRKKTIEKTKFRNCKEKNWFTDILINHECGINDIDEYVKIMLKGYRKNTKEKACNL